MTLPLLNKRHFTLIPSSGANTHLQGQTEDRVKYSWLLWSKTYCL